MEKFEQHVSGIGSLQGAVDGTPVKRKQGERKANPNGLAESTFACRCLRAGVPHLRGVRRAPA